MLLQVEDENAKHLKFCLERNSRKVGNTGTLESGYLGANKD
jgi:hypothetical protein